MVKKAITIGAILIALSSAGNLLFAQESPYESHPEVSDLKKKISEKEQQLESLKNSQLRYEQLIQEARGQSSSLQSQLNLLDNQVTKLELDIRTTQTTIDKTKLEVEATQFQINKEQQEIETQKERLKEYIKLIHKEDQRSLLEILIVNNSFSEFFNQLNHIESIQADLKQSVDRVQLLQDALAVKKADLKIYQTALEEKKSALEHQQSRLNEQVTAKEVLLFETRHSEARYQNLLAEASQIKTEVDSSINNIRDEMRLKIERLNSGNTNPLSTFMTWPVDASRGITTYFNDPTYPFRYLFEHSALDIRAYQGTPIKAPSDAYVARARDNGYGYSYITLIHDNGLSTVYGHVSAIYVKADQFVKAGEVVGLTGGAPGSRGSGNLTTGPHLHFEVRLNGIPVDPLQYMPRL